MTVSAEAGVKKARKGHRCFRGCSGGTSHLMDKVEATEKRKGHLARGWLGAKLSAPLQEGEPWCIKVDEFVCFIFSTPVLASSQMMCFFLCTAG